MKILQQLRDIVQEAGQLKRAWFTSFNLSPAFIEGYILPLIAGMEEKPKSVRDFELIQKKLNDEEIDIRFFCDFRMADLNDGKKTAVPIHLLNPALLGKQYEHGVFHPKVMLLQNTKNETWLMTGSANLTVGGWAHNRECVYKARVKTEKNADKLEDFFQVLFEVCGETFPENFEVALSEEPDENWNFLSSLVDYKESTSYFFDNLLNSDDDHLVVWSPYFSGSLPDLIQKQIHPRMKGNARISIIPDLVENKVRIQKQPQVLERLSEIARTSFYQFDYQNKANGNDRLAHAKVWCTKKLGAVGSWNMTHSAVGTSADGTQNIEAGVILPIEKTLFQEIEKNCTPLSDVEFMNEEELKLEKPDIPANSMLFDIRVSFDWFSLLYTISIRNELILSDVTIRLPDVGSHALVLGQTELSNSSPIHLLKDHFFYIEQEGRRVQSGIIIETNAYHRPVWQFSSLNELLFSYMETFQSAEKHQVSYSNLLHEASEEGEYVSPLTPDFRFSYFSMFKAFDNMRQKLKDAMGIIDENPHELFGYVSSYPGSLIEMAGKVKEELNNPENETDTSPVFNWFVIQETNALLHEVLEFLKDRDSENWKELRKVIAQRILPIPLISEDTKVKKYLEYIRKDCSFPSKKNLQKIRSLLNE